MMCFRDMTFCTFWKDCDKGNTCPRSLTEEVQKKAEEWWGSEEAPIAYFAEKPSCWEQK